MIETMKILLSVLMELLYRFSSKVKETEIISKDIPETEQAGILASSSLFTDMLYVYDDNNNMML